jgi:hypothetical protein
MKTRSKGNRARLKAIKELEQNGYTVAVVERTGRWIKEKDAFGLFDLLCVRSTNPVLFVQVACNKPHNHMRFRKFKLDYDGPLVSHFMCEQWVWVDRKGWKKYRY